MPQFVVRETLTTMRYIEAENEASAIEIAKNRDCGDFDEVDPAVPQEFSAELNTDPEQTLAAPAREEPIWTGRYGQERLDVIERGQDFHVIHIVNLPDPEDNGTMIVGPGGLPIDANMIEGWIDNIVIRAYNAEDALRNAHGALAQWNVWYNEEGLDWETAPFTDAEGNFPADGGTRDNGFDAYPPDNAAVDGVTRPDLFPEGVDVYLVPQDEKFERVIAAGAAPRI